METQGLTIPFALPSLSAARGECVSASNLWHGGEARCGAAPPAAALPASSLGNYVG